MSKLVGIINVTPDSFSDGGNYSAPETAIAAIFQLEKNGADVVDIGAESTRPGATPISADEEWARLSPVLEGLDGLRIPISVDTRHAETAEKALAAGARWINDVSGFENPNMVDAVKNADCALVVMHSLSVPADKDIVLPADADVIKILIEWTERRFAALEKAGIARERLIFDPGIGFGKTPAQSFAILEHTHRFDALGVPLLIGHSRKSFLGDVNRDAVTLEWSKKLAARGVDYLRVHDVKAHREVLHGSR